MELCTDNLKNILDSKYQVFKRSNNNPMKELEFYISCKIFIEILQALNYIHELSPPIVHRDIKPANILFTEKGVETDIFFKLCDFGLAKLYEHTGSAKKNNSHSSFDRQFSSLNTSNTRGVGAYKYMAPEIWNGKYNTKADIYSLGVLVHQLFDLTNNLDRNDKLKKYFRTIEDLLEDMMRMNMMKRPTCTEILKGSNSWCDSLIIPENFILNEMEEYSLNIYIKYHFPPKKPVQRKNFIAYMKEKLK